MLARPNLGGEPAGHAERQPQQGEPNDQQQIVAGSRQRVRVLGADEEHEQERHDHAPAVELPLPGLTEHEEDERRVEEILRSSHAAIIRRRPLSVVGARVEPGLIFRLNPAVDLVHDRDLLVGRRRRGFGESGLAARDGREETE